MNLLLVLASGKIPTQFPHWITMMLATRRGRPSRFAEYDQLVASLPPVMDKRPKYLNGIGVFRGARGLTAWLKIRLPHGGILKGKSYSPNASVEIKVGSLDSWDWEQLTETHRDLQGKADRGEALEDIPDVTFGQFAEEWLTRAERRIRTYNNEKLAVRNSMIAELGKIGLRQLSTADINRWITKRLTTVKPPARSKADVASAGRIKPGTVQREFNTLRAILNEAVRNGLIERSPTENANAIQRGEARQRFLTNEELVALLAIAEKEAYWLPGRFTRVCARARCRPSPGPISASLALIASWSTSSIARAVSQGSSWLRAQCGTS
jgi:hypothetical protein